MNSLSLYFRDLARAMSVEALKMKRTLALWLVLVAPLSVVALYFLMYIRPSFRVRADGDAWMLFSSGVMGLWAVLMLPLFVTLEAALTSHLEHGERQWKHLFALPVSRRAIYTAKLAVNFILIGASSIILWAAAIGTGHLLRLLRPSLGFAASAPWTNLLAKIALIYLAVWLIIALHTWISLRFPSFVLAIGIGMTATVAGALIANSSQYAKFFPWSLQINVISNEPANLQIAIAFSIIGAAIAAIIGCWDMTRRDAA